MPKTHNCYSIISNISFWQIKLYALYKNPAFNRTCGRLFRAYKRINSDPENVKDLILVPFFRINNDVVN